MRELLEAIEDIQAELASPERLFGEAGIRVRSAARQRDQAQYSRAFEEAASIVANAVKGSRRARYVFEEAMGTSDFPLLFGDILDRQLLANYKVAPLTWQNYCKRSTVRDFRTVNRFSIDGSEAFLPQVNEQEEYTASSLSENRDQFSVAKRGRRVPFSWEAMINDDLGAFNDIPQRLGRAAARSEERFVTGLFVDGSGPHASLYTSGFLNIINTGNGASATNPALSITALQDGLIVLGGMVDADSEPIVFDIVHLVVPPALETVAKNIMNATEIRALTSGGGVSAQSLVVVNWMKNRLQLSINSYIPIIASSSNGNTSWFLFGQPSDGRPALELGFLAGHETPEIFMKSPNAQRVGGGSLDPMDGDFDTDSLQYKVRHVFGGTRLTNTGGAKSTVASNGSGS